MPFDDLGEQAHVFGLLEELSNHPDHQAKIDFRNPNYVLTRRLHILLVQIQELEAKTRPDLVGKSYQSHILANLLWRLEDCNTTGKLKAALPEVRELLLLAWVIQREVDYGKLELTAAPGIQRSADLAKWSEAGIAAARKYGETDHGKWLAEAIRLKVLNPKLSNRSLAPKIADNLGYEKPAIESIRQFLNTELKKHFG